MISKNQLSNEKILAEIEGLCPSSLEKFRRQFAALKKMGPGNLEADQQIIASWYLALSESASTICKAFNVRANAIMIPQKFRQANLSGNQIDYIDIRIESQRQSDFFDSLSAALRSSDLKLEKALKNPLEPRLAHGCWRLKGLFASKDGLRQLGAAVKICEDRAERFGKKLNIDPLQDRINTFLEAIQYIRPKDLNAAQAKLVSLIENPESIEAFDLKLLADYQNQTLRSAATALYLQLLSKSEVAASSAVDNLINFKDEEFEHIARADSVAKFALEQSSYYLRAIIVANAMERKVSLDYLALGNYGAELLMQLSHGFDLEAKRELAPKIFALIKTDNSNSNSKRKAQEHAPTLENYLENFSEWANGITEAQEMIYQKFDFEIRQGSGKILWLSSLKNLGPEILEKLLDTAIATNSKAVDTSVYREKWDEKLEQQGSTTLSFIENCLANHPEPEKLYKKAQILIELALRRDPVKFNSGNERSELFCRAYKIKFQLAHSPEEQQALKLELLDKLSNRPNGLSKLLIEFAQSYPGLLSKDDLIDNSSIYGLSDLLKLDDPELIERAFNSLDLILRNALAAKSARIDDDEQVFDKSLAKKVSANIYRDLDLLSEIAGAIANSTGLGISKKAIIISKLCELTRQDDIIDMMQPRLKEFGPAQHAIAYSRTLLNAFIKSDIRLPICFLFLLDNDQDRLSKNLQQPTLAELIKVDEQDSVLDVSLGLGSVNSELLTENVQKAHDTSFLTANIESRNELEDLYRNSPLSIDLAWYLQSPDRDGRLVNQAVGKFEAVLQSLVVHSEKIADRKGAYPGTYNLIGSASGNLLEQALLFIREELGVKINTHIYLDDYRILSEFERADKWEKLSGTIYLAHRLFSHDINSIAKCLIKETAAAITQSQKKAMELNSYSAFVKRPEKKATQSDPWIAADCNDLLEMLIQIGVNGAKVDSSELFGKLERRAKSYKDHLQRLEKDLHNLDIRIWRSSPEEAVYFEIPNVGDSAILPIRASYACQYWSSLKEMSVLRLLTLPENKRTSATADLKIALQEKISLYQRVEDFAKSISGRKEDQQTSEELLNGLMSLPDVELNFRRYNKIFCTLRDLAGIQDGADQLIANQPESTGLKIYYSAN